MAHFLGSGLREQAYQYEVAFARGLRANLGKGSPCALCQGPDQPPLAGPMGGLPSRYLWVEGAQRASGKGLPCKGEGARQDGLDQTAKSSWSGGAGILRTASLASTEMHCVTICSLGVQSRSVDGVGSSHGL